MANEIDDQKSGSEAQPGGLSRNKVLLLGAALVVLIVLSIALTAFLFSAMKPDAPVAERAAVAEPRPESAGIAEITELRVQVESQAEAIARLEEELMQLRESSPVKQLQGVLANQEESFQLFLTAMKTGMSDIANMVRGSRTWLEHYEGRLDDVIAQSQSRAETLSRGLPPDSSRNAETIATPEPGR